MADEGKTVRQAFDGPQVDHDKLIAEIDRMSRGEYERASDASESAAQTKEFLEETGMNGQALGWLKAIVKKLPKKDGQAKAMDIIRSLKVGLPMVENHVAGQGTAEMDLGEPDDTGEAEEAPVENPEPEVQDEETAEFNAAVDEHMGDDSDVVTPLDFNGGAA